MNPEPTAAPAVAEARSSTRTDLIGIGRDQRRRKGARWRRLAIVCLALLVLGLLLSRATAPFVASRLSRALGTQVDIGAVTFQPIDAIVTLRNVTVHAPGGSSAQQAAPIVADRVRVDVQWLPLLHDTLHVRELALESARVDLDRLPDGRFGLANLEKADPASELPEGWSFALDRITLRDSQLRVRDLAAGSATFLEATLRNADIAAMRRRASAFGKATNLRVDALVGGGQLRIEGRYDLRDDGLAMDAMVQVTDVPLAQAQTYVADLGWTELSGKLSGQLRWQREPRRRDLLSGRVILDNGGVHVADLGEPAFAVRRAIADVPKIDLLERRITIRSLTLRGATLALRPDADAPIPVLAAPPASSPPRRGNASASTSRWRWMVERFDTVNGRVRVLAADGPFIMRARAAGENLGPGAYWSPLRIEVAQQGIAAAFDGTVRTTEGLTIEGNLAVRGIDVPGVAQAAHVPWADLVRTGRATADLVVGIDSVAGNAPFIYARGRVGLTDLWVAGPHPSPFAFGAASVDLTLDRFSLREPGRRGSRDKGPMRINCSAANVRAPFALLVRTDSGWILPSLDTAADDGGSGVPEVVVRAARGNGGSLTLVDRVPFPAVTWNVARVEGSAQGVSLTALRFDQLHLRGSDMRFGDLQFVGRRSGTGGFEAAGHNMSLAATSPYLKLAGLPYSFASGTGSFIARGVLAGQRWNAEALMTLHEPALTGSDTVLQEAIGMPVSSAIALLRDQNGDVSFDVALAPAPSEGGAMYTEQVASGVRDAIGRMRESRHAAVQEMRDLAPSNIFFPPGQVDLTPTARTQLERVASVLGSHPNFVVELTPEVSPADRRWLGEQALYGKLEDSGGFVGMLRALGMRDARTRIQTALAARARGERGELKPEDEALLTRLIAQAPPVDDAQITALRESRLTRVVSYLADRYGILGQRVVMHSADSPEREDLSAVRVQISIGSNAAADARDVAPASAADAIRSPFAPPGGLD